MTTVLRTCPTTFEPRSKYPGQSERAYRRGTHTCDLFEGHDDAHHCPVCGTEWEGLKVYGIKQEK